MNNIDKDYKYVNLVDDILNHKKFLKLKENVHHGTSRFQHSLRVSYYSYKITKALKLNYIETARAGLLHDFFENDDLSEIKQRLSMFFHPYMAVKNSEKYFGISELEKDIIINHMFPTLPLKIPKHIESWIVSLVDKVIATYEFYEAYAKPYAYKVSNVCAMLILILHW